MWLNGYSKIENSQRKGPPQFVDLLSLNSGTIATEISATRYFAKFCLADQIHQIILPKIENIWLKMLKITLKVDPSAANL